MEKSVENFEKEKVSYYMVKKYFSDSRKYTMEIVTREFEKLVAYLIENEKIITIGELCKGRYYPASYLSKWARDFGANKDILTMYSFIKNTLEQRLILGGLTNKLNSGFTQFVMKNVYHYHDKIEVQSKDSKPDNKLLALAKKVGQQIIEEEKETKPLIENKIQ